MHTDAQATLDLDPRSSLSLSLSPISIFITLAPAAATSCRFMPVFHALSQGSASHPRKMACPFLLSLSHSLLSVSMSLFPVITGIKYTTSCNNIDVLFTSFLKEITYNNNDVTITPLHNLLLTIILSLFFMRYFCERTFCFCFFLLLFVASKQSE